VDDLNDILQNFSPVSLTEMDSVKLMNRSDTKFIFRRELLPCILEQLQDDYFVLEVEGVRNSRYETLYYDTVDFKMFHQHRCDKAIRQKVRLRTYLESDLHFFEIKRKTNKGKTIKDRIKRSEQTAVFSKRTQDFLLSKSDVEGKDLVPKLWTKNSRITLVNKKHPERLTIDTDLFFSNNEKEEALPELVIAELKQEKKQRSLFTDIMRSQRITEVSISKYCFGVIFLYKGIRMNNFKPKLLILNKLRHDSC
jgi:hypothetical protein